MYTKSTRSRWRIDAKGMIVLVDVAQTVRVSFFHFIFGGDDTHETQKKTCNVPTRKIEVTRLVEAA